MKKAISVALVLSLVPLCAGLALDETNTAAQEPIFLFTGTQGLQGGWEGENLKNLNLAHTLFAGVEFPQAPHTLGLWIEDSFVLDFAGLSDDTAFYRLLNNTLSVGLENTWFYKNLIYFNANILASVGTPFNQYRITGFTPGDDQPYALVTPLVRAGGKYYFGLDWSADFSLPVKTVFGMWDLSTLKPTGSFALSYEFFRYYGPRELKLSVAVADSVSLSMPLSALFEEDDEDGGGGSAVAYTLLNGLTAGLVFTWKPVSVSAGFLNNLSYNLSTDRLATRDIGFYAGVSVAVAPFVFSLTYTGYERHAAGSDTWISGLGFSWTLNLSTYDETPPPAEKPSPAQ
jgi:hypothetical protein